MITTEKFYLVYQRIRPFLLDWIDLGVRFFIGKYYLPPRSLRILTGGIDNFESIGQEFFRYFIDLGKLRADETVLEIGCGCGRMAIPLTKYIKSGSYVGVDISRQSVNWCQKHISKKYPQFKFVYIDIKSEAYNPKGSIFCENFTFPLTEKGFDLIFLTSVFTHILPWGLENYLNEIRRLLKNRTGRALLTFFILNETQAELSIKELNEIKFPYNYGTYSTSDTKIPEKAVAYEEQYLVSLFRKSKLKVEKVIYGKWTGRKDGLSWQDIMVVSELTFPY